MISLSWWLEFAPGLIGSCSYVWRKSDKWELTAWLKTTHSPVFDDPVPFSLFLTLPSSNFWYSGTWYRGTLAAWLWRPVKMTLLVLQRKPNWLPYLSSVWYIKGVFLLELLDRYAFFAQTGSQDVIEFLNIWSRKPKRGFRRLSMKNIHDCMLDSVILLA